jgi:putative addiction module killer protein
MRHMKNTVLQTAAFKAWLSELQDELAKGAIVARIVRIQSGLMGDFKTVGGKVIEFRVDVSKGYRLYATKTGKTIILLLAGGAKKTQGADIGTAHAMVEELAKRKKEAARKARK